MAVFAPKAGENLCWHPACFICSRCEELLVDLVYCFKDDAVCCERHYAEQVRPRCAACDEVSSFFQCVRGLACVQRMCQLFSWFDLFWFLHAQKKELGEQLLTVSILLLVSRMPDTLDDSVTRTHFPGYFAKYVRCNCQVSSIDNIYLAHMCLVFSIFIWSSGNIQNADTGLIVSVISTFLSL